MYEQECNVKLVHTHTHTHVCMRKPMSSLVIAILYGIVQDEHMEFCTFNEI
jgi:hypothetical protein